MNSKRQIIRDGAIAGVLGAATVALWFLLFDFSRGRLFETPALLAALLFHGTARVPTLPLVAEYTIVHVFAFIGFGVGSAVLLEAAERNRSLLPSLLSLLAAFEGLFVTLVTLLGPEFQGTLSWWSVLVGNLLATAVMVGYFFARHPQLGEHLFGPWVGVLAEGAAAWGDWRNGSRDVVPFLRSGLRLKSVPNSGNAGGSDPGGCAQSRCGSVWQPAGDGLYGSPLCGLCRLRSGCGRLGCIIR